MSFRKSIDKALYVFLATLMALMVVNVLWQVASRYIFKAPNSFTDELARFLLIWIGLLGASYATGKKLHLAIDLLPSRLEGKSSQRLNIFIHVLISLFAFFVMVWGGINLVYITLTLEQTSAALQLPLGYVYMVLPLSGMLMIYYSIANLALPPGPDQEKGKNEGLKKK